MTAVAKKKHAVTVAPTGLVNERPTGRMVRLSDPEMAPTMKAMSDRLKTDPDFRRNLLRDAGIITAKGKLAKSFGG